MTDLEAPPPGEFRLYETEDGRTCVECRFVADTLWSPQAGMDELFQTSKQNIAKHLKSIPAEAELDPDSVVSHGLKTAADGKNDRVSGHDADAHAHAQCEQFAARRRAVLEADGVEFNVRALEDAAKALPRPGKQ